MSRKLELTGEFVDLQKNIFFPLGFTCEQKSEGVKIGLQIGREGQKRAQNGKK